MQAANAISGHFRTTARARRSWCRDHLNIGRDRQPFAALWLASHCALR
jgi:hypothetical protein